MGVVLFLVVWVALDKLWDFISELPIAATGAIGTNEYKTTAMEAAGVVPMRMAISMIADIAGTLALSRAGDGYLLKWFA